MQEYKTLKTFTLYTSSNKSFLGLHHNGLLHDIAIHNLDSAFYIYNFRQLLIRQEE